MPPAYPSYPCRTYYFRTQFDYGNRVAGALLTFSNFLDDGAIFYLNGQEIQRLNMLPPPYAYRNGDLSDRLRLRGNACVDCPQIFSYTNDLFDFLVPGANDVGRGGAQSAATSSDITFGSALYYAAPPPIPPPPFIADVTVIPGETNATILLDDGTRTRVPRSNTGPRPALGNSTPLDPAPLHGSRPSAGNSLLPLTHYYFLIVAGCDGSNFTHGGSFSTVPLRSSRWSA